MAKYVLSPRAEEDLRDIWRAIAPDNERAADALRRILDKAEHPHWGRCVPISAPWREF